MVSRRLGIFLIATLAAVSAALVGGASSALADVSCNITYEVLPTGSPPYDLEGYENTNCNIGISRIQQKVDVSDSNYNLVASSGTQACAPCYTFTTTTVAYSNQLIPSTEYLWEFAAQLTAPPGYFWVAWQQGCSPSGGLLTCYFPKNMVYNPNFGYAYDPRHRTVILKPTG